MPRPPQSTANAHGRRYSPRAEPTPHEEIVGAKYRIEKLSGERWTHIASAPSVDAALKLLDEKPWTARVVRIRDGVIVAEVEAP